MKQRRIGIAGCSGGFGKTGVIFRVRQDARQRVDLEDVGLASLIQPDVQAAPVPNPQHLATPPDDVFYLRLQRIVDFSRTAEDLERLFRPVPDPFGLVRINRIGLSRKLAVVDLDDGQNLEAGRVAQDADREFAASQKSFDDSRLSVESLDFSNARLEITATCHDRVVTDSFA